MDTQSINGGDALCLALLASHRFIANLDRRHPHWADSAKFSEFNQGIIYGQLMVASVWMDADPLLVAAVRNEINFLRGAYLNDSNSSIR